MTDKEVMSTKPLSKHEQSIEAVHDLIRTSAQQHNPLDAERYAKAADNAANALLSLSALKE